EPGDRVRRPYLLAQPVRDLDEDLISHVMPEAVVDRLEPVEVDKDQGGTRRRLVPATAQLHLQPVHQQRTVRQAGERIVRRLVYQLVLRRTLIRDVLDLRHRVTRPARLAAQYRDRRQRPQHVPIDVQVPLLGVERGGTPGRQVRDRGGGGREVVGV